MIVRPLRPALALACLLAACGGDPATSTTTSSSAGGAGGTWGSGGAGGSGTGGSGGATTSSHSTTTSSHSTTTSSSTTTSTTTTKTGTTTTTTSSTGGAGGATSDCDVLGVPGNCMDTADCSAMTDHAPSPHFCPGPANIQCCTAVGLALCDPAVVVYPNDGNTTEAPGVGGCPNGMIPVSTFCVDKYEASLVEGNTGSSWSPYINPGNTPMIAVSVEGAVPQAYIDGVQASEACLNAGKRLCTDTEWLRACRGPSNTTYPYGNTKQLGVCNDHRDVHPAVQYFGTSANWIWSEIDNACIDQLPQSLDVTGGHSGCVTAEGAFDMMGNLHEWTADPAGTFRGGYYVDTVINGPGCLYATTAHNTLHWDYSTGFRCCAD